MKENILGEVYLILLLYVYVKVFRDKRRGIKKYNVTEKFLVLLCLKIKLPNMVVISQSSKIIKNSHQIGY